MNDAHTVAPKLLARLSRTFAEHGRVIYGSPVAQNASPLDATSRSPSRTIPTCLRCLPQPNQSTTVANLFFAAVHYLLERQS